MDFAHRPSLQADQIYNVHTKPFEIPALSSTSVDEAVLLPPLVVVVFSIAETTDATAEDEWTKWTEHLARL